MPQGVVTFGGAIVRYKHSHKLLISMLLASSVLALSMISATTTYAKEVVLRIQGNIEGQKNDVIELDLVSLTKLESTTFTTDQPWTSEPKEYTGVRVDVLLDHIGAKTADFDALASNEYKFRLSEIDFEKYPIIVAYKINGEFVSTRDLGPLLIVFPFNDYPELRTERNKAASVWQLTELQIH